MKRVRPRKRPEPLLKWRCDVCGHIIKRRRQPLCDCPGNCPLSTWRRNRWCEIGPADG